MSTHLSAGQIEARLDHPIIDANGHWIEFSPVFTEELRRVGGEDAVEGWNAVCNGTRSVSMPGRLCPGRLLPSRPPTHRSSTPPL